MPAFRNLGSQQELFEGRVSITLVMLFQMSALVIRSFVQTAMVDAGYDHTVAKHCSALIGFASLALFMWPIMRQAWPFMKVLFVRPHSWSRMIIACAALGFVLWLCQALALLLLAPLEWIKNGPYAYPSYPVYVFRCRDTLLLAFAIPVMSLLTPIIEEAINRGIFLHQLLPRGTVFAVLLSAALFAVLHEFSGIPNAFVFGIFAAIQMLHYRTLWAVIITHGTTNLLVELNRACLEGYWLPGEIYAGFWSPAPLIVCLLLGCLGTAWWLAGFADAGVTMKNDHPG
jgi:membrane protease YdiL (CAAX protease family)